MKLFLTVTIIAMSFNNFYATTKLERVLLAGAIIGAVGTIRFLGKTHDSLSLNLDSTDFRKFKAALAITNLATGVALASAIDWNYTSSTNFLTNLAATRNSQVDAEFAENHFIQKESARPYKKTIGLCSLIAVCSALATHFYIGKLGGYKVLIKALFGLVKKNAMNKITLLKLMSGKFKNLTYSKTMCILFCNLNLT